MRSIDDLALEGSKVLLRVDINSPIDPETGRIANDNRLDKSLRTIEDVVSRDAAVVMIAHQGDTLDYQNLVSLAEHAERLAEKLGRSVAFIDDVAGPAARARIEALEPGELLLLDNLRYLTEEVSTFENAVKLSAEEMVTTYLVRSLAPLFDFYVNDAFAAAHRNAPSMVAFQQVLPFAGGRLLVDELMALESVASSPDRPCLFVLGGLKVSDAFSMLKKVLAEGTADKVITSGVTGELMLMASGRALGRETESFIRDRSLDAFIPEAAEYLAAFPGKIEVPSDVAIERAGERVEIPVDELPVPEMIIDIGTRTIEAYEELIAGASTIFVNGPAGMYERDIAAEGTRRLWQAVAASDGVSVIGGGDTVSSATRFIDTADLGFVSTGGGALIRYLSGQALPLLEAME